MINASILLFASKFSEFGCGVAKNLDRKGGGKVGVSNSA